MGNLIYSFLRSDFENRAFNITFFFYRIAIAVVLIFTQGIKRLPFGDPLLVITPNPFGFSQDLNQQVAFICTLILPLFVVAGLATRLAAFFTALLPIAGYFIIHCDQCLVEKQVSFMYFLSFLLVVIFGGGKYSIDNCFAETIK